MLISYNSTNNSCSDSSNGFITINSINFDNQEEANQFNPYEIVWFGDLSNSILSNDHRLLSNLSSGVYSFQIKSLYTTAQSEIYTINITSPPKLEIKELFHSTYSCNFNGSVFISINGGTPPYTYKLGLFSINTSETTATFYNLLDGTYDFSVIDANGCVVTHTEQIVIESGFIDFNIDQILTPEIFDSYVPLYFNITGKNGPFNLSFYNKDTDTTITIQSLDTTYLIKQINNTYYYYIPDKLYPGQYSITMSNNENCSYTENFNLPNILPLSVNIAINPNTINQDILLYNTLPIFDTLLIPYNLIKNNTLEWQYIQNYNLKNYLPIKIGENLYKFIITRNILNKYLLDSNEIEILALGNEPEDWYFYLQIAPGINLNTNPEFATSDLKLCVDNIDFPICLGLSEDGSISKDKLSLIRGSFIMSGILNHQFEHHKTYYVSLDENITDAQDYNFITNNSKVAIHRNMYSANIVTIINFLSDFETLNQVISTNRTEPLSRTIDQYLYILNIKNLIISMNNINNINDIYIYVLDNSFNGSINLLINNQPFFTKENSVVINNSNNIEYYYFDKNSSQLNSIYKNNKKITNESSLSEMPSGFVVVSILDRFGNKPKQIRYQNQTIDYDTHFTSAIQMIQYYNNNILDYFKYGYILCYIPEKNETANSVPTSQLTNIPSFIQPVPVQQQQSITIFNKNTTDPKVIKQLNKTTDSSLNIKISPKLTKCILKGPDNYELILTEDTKIINMIPGVYNLYGDDQELFTKNLYQNNTRIILDKNNNLDIDIKFNSYLNKTIIKEI